MAVKSSRSLFAWMGWMPLWRPVSKKSLRPLCSKDRINFCKALVYEILTHCAICRNKRHKIDNVDYDTDKLSNEAKAQLINMQFCDQELARLQAQAAAYQTARMAYARAMKEALPTPLERAQASDTLQLN